MNENENQKKPVKKASAFREWVSDYLRYFILIGAIIIVALVIFLIVMAVKGKKPESIVPEAVKTEAVKEDVNSESDADEEAEGVSDLDEVDVYEAVFDLINDYLTSVENKDGKTAANLREGVDDAFIANVETGKHTVISKDVETFLYPDEGTDNYVAVITFNYDDEKSGKTLPHASAFYILNKGNGEFKISGEDKTEEINQVLDIPEVAEMLTEISKKAEEILADEN